MSKRHFNIAVVFVWALAHGVWMGAGWHSFSELGALNNSCENRSNVASCAGCARGVESAASASLPVLDAKSACCEICKLSTVLPEVAVAQTPVYFGAQSVFEPPLALEAMPGRFVVCQLPPAHAPPA